MIKIERLKKEDIPQLLELYKELVLFDNKVCEAEKLYEEIIKDDNYYLIAAKKDNELLGSMLGVCCKSLASMGEPFLVIEDVVVKENTRGMGIGKKLMDEIDKFAIEKRCNYAILVSSDHREAAHKFYEKVGFVDGVLGFRKVY